MANDIFTKFQMPEEYLNSEHLSTVAMAAKASAKINKELESKLLDIIADYNVEFAAELDDWLEGKKRAEDINLERLNVQRENDMFTTTDTNVVYLDGQPIAEYKLVSTIHDKKAKVEYQITRL